MLSECKGRKLSIVLKDISKETLKESGELNELNNALNEENFSVYLDNDGIGVYEYWGHKGFDKGTDYLALEDVYITEVTITFETLPDGTKAEDIVKVLNEQLDVKKTLKKSIPKKHAHSIEDTEDFELNIRIDFRNPKLEGTTFTTTACWIDN